MPSLDIFPSKGSYAGFSEIRNELAAAQPDVTELSISAKWISLQDFATMSTDLARLQHVNEMTLMISLTEFDNNNENVSVPAPTSMTVTSLTLSFVDDRNGADVVDWVRWLVASAPLLEHCQLGVSSSTVGKELDSSALKECGIALAKLSALTRVRLIGLNDECSAAVLRGVMGSQSISTISMDCEIKAESAAALAQFLVAHPQVNARTGIEFQPLPPALGQLIPDLPAEVASQSNEHIISYLRAVSNSAVTVYRTKLMLVGYGAVGKTSLLRSLKKEKQPEQSEATQGITIADWVITRKDGDSEANIQVSCWDFAGQEEYYVTHQLFLSERCIYLLVWNPRIEKQDKVEYWLRSIQSKDKRAVVFVVASKMDEYFQFEQPAKDGPEIDPARMDEGGLQDKFPEMSIRHFHVSNRPHLLPAGRVDGVGKLRDAISTTAEQLGKIVLPETWLKLESFIVGKRPEHRRVLLSSKLVKWAKEAAQLQGDSCQTAINTLHNWGSLLRYKINSITDLCVIDPQWLSEVAKLLVSARQRVPELQFGVLTAEQLQRVWQDHVEEEDLLETLRLVQHFELSFELSDGSQLVPSLLYEKPRDTERKAIELRMSETVLHDRRQHRFDLSFVPANLMTRIIFRTHKFTVEHGNKLHSCWKNYVVLMKDDSVATISMDLDQKQVLIKVAGVKPSIMCGQLADMILETLAAYENVAAVQRVPCPRCPGPEPLWFKAASIINNKTGELTCTECDGTFPVAELLPSLGYTNQGSIHLSSAPSARVATYEQVQQLAAQVASVKSGVGEVQASVDSVRTVVVSTEAKVDEANAGIQQIANFISEFQRNQQPQQLTSHSSREEFERRTLGLLQMIDQRTQRLEHTTWDLATYLTPRIFFLTEHHTKSMFKQLFGVKPMLATTFDLHLMCEMPRHMHALLDEPPYKVEVQKEWWIKVGPVLYYTLKVAKVVLAAAPIAGLPLDSVFDQAADLVKEGMKDSLADFDSIKQDTKKLSTTLEHHGAALREFSAWMNTIDPTRKFQKLVQAKLPTGEVCYVCAKHKDELDNHKVPEKVPSLYRCTS